MTGVTPEHPSEATATVGPPPGWDRRWDTSYRRGGRPFRVAALVVTLAGVVFIIAVIFWSGFILGVAEGGHSSHHHGMAPHGVVIGQIVPSVLEASS
jgi:hypothetical protein